MKLPCYMKATTAIHKMGDISRKNADYCYVTKQTDEGYIGNWVEGYGFVNVVFPTDTTRELTKEEQEYVDNQNVIIIS